jgi:predicted lipoprotein with Yx(FWY)xxD motif
MLGPARGRIRIPPGDRVRVLRRLSAAAGLVAACSALVLLGAAPTGAASVHGPTSLVEIVHTPDGPVIANAAGMTLYVFVDDLLTSAPSACVGDCHNDWPPAFARGSVRVAAGITGRIGTVDRFGQGRQLTMDGRPLYTFSGDTPGELRGNGIGNIWWAMTPSGLSATSFRAVPPTYGDPGPTTLTVVDTKYGRVVANDRGQVLYDYADDTPTASACNAAWCLVDWPPLQGGGAPTAARSITGAVAVIDGAGGTRQVTLGGHPLYTFAGDLHPGDTRGQGIGSDWYLVSPAGNTVEGHATR